MTAHRKCSRRVLQVASDFGKCSKSAPQGPSARVREMGRVLSGQRRHTLMPHRSKRLKKVFLQDQVCSLVFARARKPLLCT